MDVRTLFYYSHKFIDWISLVRLRTSLVSERTCKRQMKKKEKKKNNLKILFARNYEKQKRKKMCAFKPRSSVKRRRKKDFVTSIIIISILTAMPYTARFGHLRHCHHQHYAAQLLQLGIVQSINDLFFFILDHLCSSHSWLAVFSAFILQTSFLLNSEWALL